MGYQIRIDPKAEKELLKINNKDQNKILVAMGELQKNPYLGKKLKGVFQGTFCLRAWPYRIIYEIFKQELIIVIIRVGHRKDVYRK